MKLALFGYGGHAKEVAAHIDDDVTFFVDDEYANEVAKPISEFDPTEYVMMVAVSDSRDRYDIVQRLPKETEYFTYIHPSTIILDNNFEIPHKIIIKFFIFLFLFLYVIVIILFDF